jgi:hypothetical protein
MLPEGWPIWGPISAAAEEGGQRGKPPRLLRVPPAEQTPPAPPMKYVKHSEHITPLERAIALLRDRLNRLEAPEGPLSPRAKRLLSHQTNRLSHIVETLIFAPTSHERDRRAA